MLPNYSGRLLDKLILIVAKQTADIKENSDDPSYPVNRGIVLETTTRAMWEARERLHQQRRARRP